MRKRPIKYDSFVTNSGLDYTKLVGNDENFDTSSNIAGEKTQEFIEKNKNDVIESAKGTGLFPSVSMAQMILEGSWGQGVLAQKANNCFGLKADNNWSGQKILLDTPRDVVKQRYFKVYETPLDSISDHNNFLQTNPRYQKAKVFSATSPEQQIQNITKAGYGEVGKYDKAIIDLINAYHLKDLDVVKVYESIEGDQELQKTQQALDDYTKRNWIPIVMMGVGIIGLIIALEMNKKSAATLINTI